MEKTMKEYDDITLKRLQSIELMILNDFKRMCKKHGLQYFAFAGSGIGALRHGGFIPWDDDIDVGLLREDYEKALKYFAEEEKEKYIVMNPRFDPDYPLMTTRLMLRGTKFREHALKDVKCDLGIFLDLYAFDQEIDDEKKFKKQSYEAWFYTHLMMMRSIPFPVLPMKGATAKLVHAITGMTYGVLSACRVSKRWLADQAEKAATRYNHLKTKKVSFFYDTLPCICWFSYDELFPLVELPFENTTVFFPKEQDRYLKDMYGDYMQLPPEEKRKNHYPYELDFGPYAEIPLEDLRNPDLYIDPKNYK